MPKNTKERAALVKARGDAEQLVEDARDAVADAMAEVRNAETEASRCLDHQR